MNKRGVSGSADDRSDSDRPWVQQIASGDRWVLSYVTARAFAAFLGCLSLSCVGCASRPPVHTNLAQESAPPVAAPGPVAPDPDAIKEAHDKADREAPFDTAVAERHHLEALDLQERTSGPDTIATAESLRRVALFYFNMCRHLDALTLLERASGILDAGDGGANARATVHLHRAYGELRLEHLDQVLEQLAAASQTLQGDSLETCRLRFELLTWKILVARSRSDARAEIGAKRSRFELSLKHPEFSAWRSRALAELHEGYVRIGEQDQAVTLAKTHDLVVRTVGDASVQSFEPPLNACVPIGDEKPVGFVKNEMAPVIQRRALLRTCLKASRGDDARVRNDLFVALVLDERGVVSAARVAGMGIPADGVDCVLSVLTKAQFERPVGGRATLLFPLPVPSE